MHVLKATLAALALLAIAGCSASAAQDPLSPSPAFAKSGAYAYRLLESAYLGHDVLKTDVSKALARAEVDAVTQRDKEISLALDIFRTRLESNRGTKDDAARLSTCQHAAQDVFESYGDKSKFADDYQACVKEP